MMVTLTEVDHKIDAHVDICAIRYEGIEKETRGIHARIKRLEQILISGGGAIIMLLITMLMKGH
tara:strand:+ start:10669 stop:10860 length:192 start_codon:yes stop_codon:yes gene_type:complete